MNNTNAQTEALKNSDYSVISAIFDQYAPLIYNYVVRFCHNPEQADIIFGDVFFQLLKKLSLRKLPSSDPRLYLYRMVYNTILKDLGNSGKKPQSFITSLPSREEEQAIKAATLSAQNKEIK